MVSKFENFYKYIPNIISFFSVVSGIFSIKYAIQGNFNEACIMILTGAIFDFIDGFLARKLQATSEDGKLIDTLCDFSTFGFASFIVCEIFWNFSIIFSISGLVYLAAIIYRLVKFTSNSSAQKDFFLGIPSPIAAIFFLFPLIFLAEFNIQKNKLIEILIFLYNIFIAFSAVSKIKMISNKNLGQIKKFFKFRNKKIYVLLSPIVFLFVFFLFTKPILSIGFFLILYYSFSLYINFSFKDKQDKLII